LIIRLIIQAILLYPLGAVRIDAAPNVSRQDATSTVQSGPKLLATDLAAGHEHPLAPVVPNV
jgi:hypothetical protein